MISKEICAELGGGGTTLELASFQDGVESLSSECAWEEKNSFFIGTVLCLSSLILLDMLTDVVKSSHVCVYIFVT